MNTSSIYKVTDYGEEMKPQLQLRHFEWDILLSLDGKASLSHITHRLNLKTEEVQPLIEQLLEYEMIEEQTLSYEEYLSLSGRSKRGTEPAQAPLAASLRSTVRLPPVPAEFKDPEPARTAVSRSLSVSALINFIVSKAPSPTEGQIAVYRVFLRVPPELLKKNEIRSLSLVNDQTRVDDPELQDSLASAVEQMLQQPLPDSVFV
ncbi:MAG: hypothetical protein AAGH72_06155 [Verrucomicrobiota bacterium]